MHKKDNLNLKQRKNYSKDHQFNLISKIGNWKLPGYLFSNPGLNRITDQLFFSLSNPFFFFITLELFTSLVIQLE